ncbi:MAG: Phosphoenolpyruvate synthase [uncultured Solirubrobacteraceae bacterium]|uniref:Phosphoenolpyruvate synthase n=1 Tax=uncultured Solirubrobacteraceae bacterium TaxID=1162706 RepID=A0A6J4SG29_9ACTN|nr:MAG: Phosphoenolpyruvate synthase [uncultured Solirubrobacteraceae bacterium]
MSQVVPLAEARDDALFGSKAVGLGQAARGGLPLPPGVALSGMVVEAVASGDELALGDVGELVRPLGGPLAVRSSAVDEDGAQASFAGQHLTLLNIPSADDVGAAVREVWWSANSDSAITYRQRVGLFRRPSVGVVVQALLDPESAGVMFTRNPINGADERVIDASWGLGEAVVAGRVIPDNFRIDRSGHVLQRTAGFKTIAIRTLPDGGTVDEKIPRGEAERLCLDDGQLAELHRLAERCEEIYGPDRDIEWAFAGGQLYLLQCRAITALASEAPPTPADPVNLLQQTRLFGSLEREELEQIGVVFKERRFAAGDTVIQQGSGGAAFYVIESGEAAVTIAGEQRRVLRAGDHFGEIALIDEGVRMATITAISDLVCYGLTLWEFRPLVQQNGNIGWKLMQTLARALRAAEEALAEARREA